MQRCSLLPPLLSEMTSVLNNCSSEAKQHCLLLLLQGQRPGHDGRMQLPTSLPLLLFFPWTSDHDCSPYVPLSVISGIIMAMTESHRFPFYTGCAYSKVRAGACQLQDKKKLNPPHGDASQRSLGRATAGSSGLRLFTSDLEPLIHHAFC